MFYDNRAMTGFKLLKGNNNLGKFLDFQFFVEKNSKGKFLVRKFNQKRGLIEGGEKLLNLKLNGLPLIYSHERIKHIFHISKKRILKSRLTKEKSTVDDHNHPPGGFGFGFGLDGSKDSIVKILGNKIISIREPQFNTV